MSFVKYPMAIGFAFLFAAAPVAYAQVGGGTELPNSAEPNSVKPGGGMKGGMMKKGGSMKKMKMNKKKKRM